MARRRYGAGTVKQRSDGRWEGQLRLPDGRRQYVYGADRRQVISRLREERWRIASGIPRKANGLTLEEYLPEWLEVCRGRLRPKTLIPTRSARIGSSCNSAGYRYCGSIR